MSFCVVTVGRRVRVTGSLSGGRDAEVPSRDKILLRPAKRHVSLAAENVGLTQAETL